MRAVPEDGKANDALIALVAKSLKIPASRIKLASGATSRHKIWRWKATAAEFCGSDTGGAGQAGKSAEPPLPSASRFGLKRNDNVFACFGGRDEQDQYRQFLRGFQARPGDRPRDAAHRDGRRRRALHRALRPAIRGPVLRRLRPRHRLSQEPGRRPAGLPHRLRQDGAGYFAQCRRQSRLCRLPLPRAGLSRRHAVLDLGSHRPQGKLQPPDRRGLCPFARLQPARRDACSNMCAG